MICIFHLPLNIEDRDLDTNFMSACIFCQLCSSNSNYISQFIMNHKSDLLQKAQNLKFAKNS